MTSWLLCFFFRFLGLVDFGVAKASQAKYMPLKFFRCFLWILQRGHGRQKHCSQDNSRKLLQPCRWRSMKRNKAELPSTTRSLTSHGSKGLDQQRKPPSGNEFSCSSCLYCNHWLFFDSHPCHIKVTLRRIFLQEIHYTWLFWTTLQLQDRALTLLMLPEHH